MKTVSSSTLLRVCKEIISNEVEKNEELPK